MKPSQAIYMQLAGKIAGMISKGPISRKKNCHRCGRSIQDNGISIGTVLQAFNHLQDVGLITSRERSGYFVSHQPGRTLPLPQIIPATMSEQTIRIDNLLRKLRKTSPEIISSPLPMPSLIIACCPSME